MDSPSQIVLRGANDADGSTVYAIKKAAFSTYVARQYGDWNEAEQLNFHRKHFLPEAIRIITFDHSAVGYVSVVNESDCVTVSQIMIRPEYQGMGIGTHCIALIRDEAGKIGNPVHLQVMKVNPRAMNFYRRIGFVVTGETDTHYQMKSTP